MIGVIGAGAFGTALAVVQAAAGRATLLWGRDAAAIAETAARRENQARLPGVPAGTDTRMASNIDVCPTLLHATGATAGWPVQGLPLQEDWARDDRITV